MLKKYHPLFISIHTNHPRELTTEVRDALARLAEAGIPLGNQSVFLKHVNDDLTTMTRARAKIAHVSCETVLPLSMRFDFRLSAFARQRSQGH